MKTPGAWEVYNLADDVGESKNLAAQQAEQIAAVEKLLQREVADNAVFPLTIPGVNDAQR
jgi:hypothetical protein